MAVLLHLLFLTNVSGPGRPPPGETKEIGKRCRGEKKSAGDASAAFLGPQVNRLPATIKLKMAAVQKYVFEPLPAPMEARFRAG